MDAVCPVSITLWESQELVLSEEGQLLHVGFAGTAQRRSWGRHAQPGVGGGMGERGSAFPEQCSRCHDCGCHSVSSHHVPGPLAGQGSQRHFTNTP